MAEADQLFRQLRDDQSKVYIYIYHALSVEDRKNDCVCVHVYSWRRGRMIVCSHAQGIVVQKREPRPQLAVSTAAAGVVAMATGGEGDDEDLLT